MGLASPRYSRNARITQSARPPDQALRWRRRVDGAARANHGGSPGKGSRARWPPPTHAYCSLAYRFLESFRLISPFRWSITDLRSVFSSILATTRLGPFSPQLAPCSK